MAPFSGATVTGDAVEDSSPSGYARIYPLAPPDNPEGNAPFLPWIVLLLTDLG